MSVVLIILSIFVGLYELLYLGPTYFYKLKYKLKRKKIGKKIYLTFDDGPSEYTLELLSVLEEDKIKATFFCVAKFMEERPDVIDTMICQGHVIGLHSYKHDNGLLMMPYKTREDLLKSLNITKLLGLNVHFFRPPWGHLSYFMVKYMRKAKLELVLWNVMAEDWESNATPEIISEKLLERIKGSDIICLHDGRGKCNAPKKTIDALRKVIPILLERGYEFETIN